MGLEADELSPRVASSTTARPAVGDGREDHPAVGLATGAGDVPLLLQAVDGRW